MLSLCPFFWELIAKLGLLLLGHEEQEGVFGSAHFLVVQSKLSRRRICTCQKGGKHTQTHAHTIPSEPTHTLSYAHTHTHNAVRDGANQSCIGIIHTHTHTHTRTHTHTHPHTHSHTHTHTHIHNTVRAGANQSCIGISVCHAPGLANTLWKPYLRQRLPHDLPELLVFSTFPIICQKF